MKMLIKNAKQIVNNQLEDVDVLIESHIIRKIDRHINDVDAEIINANGALLTPGLIDVHIHLREPGGEHKETIKTGTNAAARGGFTTVCAMPNTNPVPGTVRVVRELHEKIKNDALVRVLPYASITKDLLGEELTDMKEISKENIFAFTDDGVGIQTAGMMFEAMQAASKVNKAIVAHCEDNSILYGGVAHLGEISERLNVPGIPSVCESVQIARDVLLAEAADCHYHVCHVSTKESVRVIRNAKEAGIHVTAEVTPHHLILNETDVKVADPNYKMNPPLRSVEDQAALLEGLIDGTIDFIATDHAPHTEEEKNLGFIKGPFGIVGLETAFSLLYTYLVKEDKITLQQLVNALTKDPAEVFALPYGTMDIGSPADLVLIDLNKREKIDKTTFYSKAKNTPFDGWDVTGIPVLTIVDGNIVYDQRK